MKIFTNFLTSSIVDIFYSNFSSHCRIRRQDFENKPMEKNETKRNGTKHTKKSLQNANVLVRLRFPMSDSHCIIHIISFSFFFFLLQLFFSRIICVASADTQTSATPIYFVYVLHKVPINHFTDFHCGLTNGQLQYQFKRKLKNPKRNRQSNCTSTTFTNCYYYFIYVSCVLVKYHVYTVCSVSDSVIIFFSSSSFSSSVFFFFCRCELICFVPGDDDNVNGSDNEA